jgi:hypothetical protein
MKYLFRLILVVTAISFGGCYTILWSPQEQLPSENNNQVFYSEPYYGNYNYYYDYPWWITGRQLYITPTPVPSQSPVINSTGTNSVRNANGTRNNPDNNGSIIRTGTPSRNSESNDNSASKTNTTTTNSNSNNSGEQTRSSGNSRSNDGNNSARNNNGNRDSGNGRR